MLFLIGGELRERHFPTLLTDDDWSELEKLSGLPPKARHELDDYIGFCRELRADATTKFGDFWFNKLAALIKAEKESKKQLDGMIKSGEFFRALAMGLDGQEQIPAKELQLIRDWIERASEEKVRLLDWYNEARQRVHHYSTGEKTGRTALIEFVKCLNKCLLRHTKQPVTTGNRNLLGFVVKVCVIAFPDLIRFVRKERKVRMGSTQKIRYDRAERRVRKAIEQVTKQHYSRSWDEEITDWQHLVPGWKPVGHLDIEAKGVQMRFRKDGEATEWRINQQTPDPIEVIYPGQPFASDEVAAKQFPRSRS